MGYIYKITNDVNSKMYIGKTEYTNPEKRWKEHLSDYKKDRCEKRPLYAAMNKYGEEHFHFEVLEETNNPDDTCKREQYWINELRTYVGFKDCSGYNATLGGDGKVYINLDEDEVIRYHTEEALYVVGNTAKYFNVDRTTIKKILKKHNTSWLNSKDAHDLYFYQEFGGVLQVDIKTKIILNIFENATQAGNTFPSKAASTVISKACANIKPNHYAYGYLWYYGKDLREAIDNGEIIDIRI